MKIHVFVKEHNYLIEVGDGSQSIKWLTDVANFRYRKDVPASTAHPVNIRLETG
jgi:hypothetical protein